MGKGKIIVLDGTDGSGKATQLELLRQRLYDQGIAFRAIDFPRYDEPSSVLVQMYLGGKFGDDPNACTAHEASLFYTVDRIASYKTDWKKDYVNGELFIFDRYTSASAVHQGSKLPKEQRGDFFEWLYDLEYAKAELPAPDLVIYLEMPLKVTLDLMRKREAKSDTKADIHEKNDTHLALSMESAKDAAEYYGWKTVTCAEGDAPRSIEAISEDIWQIVKDFLATTD